MRATGSHVAAFVQVQLLEEMPVGPLIGLTLGLVILFSVEGPRKTCSRVVFDLSWQKVCFFLHSPTILDQGPDLCIWGIVRPSILYCCEDTSTVETTAELFTLCAFSFVYTINHSFCGLSGLPDRRAWCCLMFSLVVSFGWFFNSGKGNFGNALLQPKLYFCEFILFISTSVWLSYIWLANATDHRKLQETDCDWSLERVVLFLIWVLWWVLYWTAIIYTV